MALADDGDRGKLSGARKNHRLSLPLGLAGWQKDGPQIHLQDRGRRGADMARYVKRFTETNKWADPWYRKMSPAAKLLWSYMTDFCNCAGIIDLDEEAASFHIGQQVKPDHLAELGTRIQQVAAGRYYIRQFIPFQYGELSLNCPAHQPIFKMVERFGLQKNGMGYDYPTDRISTEPPIDKPEAPAEKLEKWHKNTRTVLHLLNEATGRHFREIETHCGIISARLSEPGVDLEGVKNMIARQCQRWKGDSKMNEYLQPSTLFGKEKFDNYYSARELPVTQQLGPGGIGDSGGLLQGQALIDKLRAQGRLIGTDPIEKRNTP